MKTKEEVKNSMSQGVKESKRERQDLPQAPSRGPGRGGGPLDFSTSRLSDSIIGGTKRECL